MFPQKFVNIGNHSFIALRCAEVRKKSNFSLLQFGVLLASVRDPLEQRLLLIVEKIYQQYSVSDTAIEQVFFGKNPNSAFKLGQVFGLCAYQAQRAGSTVFPYAARYIKKAVTGSGGADKKAVQIYVLNIFGITPSSSAVSPAPPATDATDALAVALCHFYQKQNPNLQSRSLSVSMNVKGGT